MFDEVIVMGIRDQLYKLKENWLIVVLFLILIIVMFGSTFLGGIRGISKGVMEEAAVERAYYPPPGFAPEVEERVIIKDSSLSTEVKRGEFQESESRLKSIITSSGSYILNENVRVYGEGWRAYHSGSYQIKVETSKYDAVLSQLKEIGEVKSFRENARDVTGTYTDLETKLAAEKARLARYNEMYSQATDISDKIELNDRIFNQERIIKYLENAIRNIDQRVDYSQISFTTTEKRSGYANIVFVKFSELIRGFVNSLNALIKLLVYVIPWAIAFLIIRWIVRAIGRVRER